MPRTSRTTCSPGAVMSWRDQLVTKDVDNGKSAILTLRRGRYIPPMKEDDLDLTGEEALLVVTLQRKHGLSLEVALDVIQLVTDTLMSTSRCGALNSNGNRCRKIAADGKSRCPSHERLDAPVRVTPRDRQLAS